MAPPINGLHKATLAPCAVLDKDSLDPVEFVVDPDPNVIQNVEKRYWKVVGDELQEMSQVEKDAVDGTKLPQDKVAKAKRVDARTQELILEGFTYDSRMFSLSDKAQATWNSIALEGKTGTLVYPVEVSAVDVDVSYSIPDALELKNFFQAFRSALKTRLKSGRDIKVQIRDAAMKVVLDAIVDPR